MDIHSILLNGYIHCKWSMMIFFTLLKGPQRPSTILKSIPGLSKKVLYERLHSLQRDGLLERRVIRIFPSHVEYRFSRAGKRIIPLLKEIEGIGIPWDTLSDVMKCKWMKSIILTLSNSPLRTTQIKNALAGISGKVLSERLKKLQRYKLINKKMSIAVPVVVEYELTHSGRLLANYLKKYSKKMDCPPYLK